MKYLILSFMLTGCFLEPEPSGDKTQESHSNVSVTSICDQYVYIDKVSNICWMRDNWNSASIGFQIPCEAALKCLR